MRKLLFCVFVLLFGGVICAQGDEDESFQDYWPADYDNFYDYDFLKQQGEELDSIVKSNENLPVNDKDVDEKVAEEIKHFREESENDNAAKEEFDALDDYQFEDNRQKSQEDVNKGETDSQSIEGDAETLNKSTDSQSIEGDVETLNKSTESLEKDTVSVESLETNVEKENKSISKELDVNADYALLWGDDGTTPPLPLPIAEDDKKIFDETQELLNGDDKDDYGFEDDKQDIHLSVEEQANLEKIIAETKNLLNDNGNQFEDVATKENSHKNEDKSTYNNIENQAGSVEDDDEKAKALHEELQALFNTFDKLNDEGSEEMTKEAIDDADSLNVLDYEEKFDKPYKEGLALSQRVDQDQDYELIDDSNLSEIFSKTNVPSNEAADGIDKDFDSNIDDVVKTESNLDNDSDASVEREKSIEDTTTSKVITYENDALVDDEKRADSAEVEEFEVGGNSEENYFEKTSTNSEKTESKETSVNGQNSEEHTEVRQKMVDDLTSSEFDDLMEQFSIFHSEDLDVHSEEFSKNTSPIHISLSVDEPVVVTSPNYPDPYPTNNIIDWIFEGEGMGIELNITDFAVNGALGDYVLVKPGGVDETGHDGLVFSYRLTSERRYRFTDVNKMFVRFEAKLGMMFLRGFKFSVKLISPLPEEPEETPEPEAVLSPPVETLTLHLGGVTLEKFRDMEGLFRELIADMAAEYISDNHIDPGMNITYEITQITNTALCNINWPGHENCASVTIGVPLTYDEDADYRLNSEDLEKMWRTYVTRDPFALQLRRMGITEFVAPDESSVMMVWLVIAAGVVISMAMLAFALWRFSCFEDYTRMPAYSDTDSLKNEKRGLDLYPTPHQILPPLYSENDYKWADDSTRVDMGGLANRSYMRDDLYDFDSEDESVPNRDRFTTDV